MMDLQQMFNDFVDAARVDRLNNSSQLTLGVLILKLEAIEDKELQIVFDDGFYHPVKLDSWRGSYAELALDYSSSNEKMMLSPFIWMLKQAIDRAYQGYKGGDFLMSEDTPIWVAGYGVCRGFKTNEDHDCQAVVNVSVADQEVIIHTEVIPF